MSVPDSRVANGIVNVRTTVELFVQYLMPFVFSRNKKNGGNYHSFIICSYEEEPRVGREKVQSDTEIARGGECAFFEYLGRSLLRRRCGQIFLNVYLF
jgi:hypothetical protein